MSSVHGSSLTFGLFGFSQYILDQNELQYLRLQLWFLPESRRPACSLFWSGQPPLWMFDGSWSPFSGSYPPGHLATLPPGHIATWPFKITWKPSSPLFEQGYCAEARCQLGRERDQGIACYQHQQYKSASISNRNLFQEPVVIPRKCRPIMGPLNIPIFHQSEHDTQQTRERTTFRRDETK